jgi:hypothetical protein
MEQNFIGETKIFEEIFDPGSGNQIWESKDFSGMRREMPR